MLANSPEHEACPGVCWAGPVSLRGEDRPFHLPTGPIAKSFLVRGRTWTRFPCSLLGLWQNRFSLVMDVTGTEMYFFSFMCEHMCVFVCACRCRDVGVYAYMWMCMHMEGVIPLV